MIRAYGISQIQFDCLSYIKEFGARPAEWTVGTCEEPERQLRDAADALWLTRPALTEKAARAVVANLHRRYGVAVAESQEGRHVFLVRPAPSQNVADIPPSTGRICPVT